MTPFSPVALCRAASTVAGRPSGNFFGAGRGWGIEVFDARCPKRMALN